MNSEEKKKQIEKYIRENAERINSQYKDLINEDMIKKGIEKYSQMDGDFEDTIAPKIDEEINKLVDDFMKDLKRIKDFMDAGSNPDVKEIAQLDLGSSKSGIYLSQQQIDLLIITELSSKEKLEQFITSISGQFPGKSASEIITNLNDIATPEQLEKAKRELYDKYLESIENYISYADMSNPNKARIKLEKLGIEGEDLSESIKMIQEGKVKDVFTMLSSKYGNDFVTKFNHLMNDDFENVSSVSYDEMASLAEHITDDKSMDTIVMATGKYGNMMARGLNGKQMNPYFTSKAIKYIESKEKHVRYHALFDQAHVEKLLREGKGKESHDQILADMRRFVKESMNFIERKNKDLPDGSKLINEVEIFNELVEKNKVDASSEYSMVWEKYFGITINEIMSCFDGIKKPEGVDFMYNEATLSESKSKRDAVEKLIAEMNAYNPDLITVFGDQMHLSSDDIMSEKGIENLTEAAKMLKRLQDGKVIVDGKEVDITPLKTECTEHDFHFTKEMLEEIAKLPQGEVNMWALKRGMQDKVSKVYNENGATFERSTYWTIFGKNDHNLVRANLAILEENKKREKEGLEPLPYIDTMYSGLLKDGRTFDDIKTLEKVRDEEKEEIFDKRSPEEIKKAEEIREKNLEKIKEEEMEHKIDKPVTLKYVNSNYNGTGSVGFINVLLIIFILGFSTGGIFATLYRLIVG